MKYLKALLLFFVPLIVLFVISNTLNYFDILSNGSIKYINLIIVVLSSVIASIYVGKRSEEKGYLEGIKMSLIIIAIIFSFSFLAYDKSFSIMKGIFYLIISVSCITGSVIGINNSKKD